VIQWGGAHVHKVGGKVFAIGGEDGVVFKATSLSYTLLLEQGLGTRAPYLPRGNWVRVAALPEDELLAYLGESYRLVAASLTRAVRRELGLG
jgi:predicted DNA-binding protein (MmcQ/YjbR family)